MTTDRFAVVRPRKVGLKSDMETDSATVESVHSTNADSNVKPTENDDTNTIQACMPANLQPKVSQSDCMRYGRKYQPAWHVKYIWIQNDED